MMSLRAGMEDDHLPGLWRSLMQSMRLAYRAEPKLLVIAFVLMTASWLPDAFSALWLKWLIDGVVDSDQTMVAWAAVGLALAAAAGWLLRTIGSRIEMRFRDRATIEVEAHVAKLQATVASIEHHERPAYLDRLQLLREQVFLLNHIYSSLMGSIGSVGRLVITLVLLGSIHPSLVLLGVFAVPTVWVSARRAAAERRAEEHAAGGMRLSRHLFDLGTSAGPGKEIRVDGTAGIVADRRRAAWGTWYDEVAAARWRSAAWHSAAWTLFGLAYVGAIVFVASGLDAPPGDVVLALAAGANLSRYLGVTVGQAEFLRWTIDAAQRLVWLEDYAEQHRDRADMPVPERLRDGIRLEHVSFRYPETERLVLEDVNLDLRAGSVVALVGENGAGKTTLVKLLCRFYEPTDGSITVDGVDLSRLPAAEWRERLSGAFQDFFRFEYEARRTIGVGDIERLDEVPIVEMAVARAGADDVVGHMPRGLDTQLGPTWREGVELSIGQWQKLALARGFMRDQPLLCVLDEPTAALDAETEHSLFERFAAASREGSAAGRVTVLVSHRFSTVRMADLIVVLDGAHVVESGSHDELMARNGLYAELYSMQATAYR
ncbi:MAG TPA: ABC transporter ATP-binding protein [Acidimicrobiales bacterium]|jgi:ATP-binding cassette subfamily B protein|nr:ABC transporter ATP-binding protein [Acidimicrobiales bacterium]